MFAILKYKYSIKGCSDCITFGQTNHVPDQIDQNKSSPNNPR